MTANLLTPALQLSGCQTVRKRRELPIAGRVLVQEGDQVQSDTVVAEAEREGELRIVRVAEVLSVPPHEACQRMTVQPGSSVECGDIIAELRGLWGLFKTQVQAPIAGIVEFISEATGHVGIRAPSGTIAVRAYIRGVVERIEPGRGAVIRAEATVVQGIFGVGGERSGVIMMLPVRPDQRVGVGDIPEQCEGAVLIGGHSPSIEALRIAAARGAVGFVTASIDDVTLAQYVGYDIGIALTGDEQVSMTLIITEGFGTLAMNERVVSLLSRASGAQASINGATQVRAGAQRPEIITRVTQEEGTRGEQSQGALEVGSRVRIVRVPYFGVQGRVVALPKELTQIETGAMARVALVALESGESTVAVPRANVELVG
jgi:hypothetical protein